MTDTDHIEHPEKLKVVELKEELEKRGLDTKGLKKDVSGHSSHPPFRLLNLSVPAVAVSKVHCSPVLCLVWTLLES